MFLRYFVFGAHAADGALRGVPAEGAARNRVRARGRLPPLKKSNRDERA